MGNTDFQSSNDQGNYSLVQKNSGALNSVMANRNVIALSIAAMMALAGASASQIAAFSGTNYNGSAGACANSFQITSHEDPHIETMVGGQAVSAGLDGQNINNLTTVYNTNNGETKLSTILAATVVGPGGSFNGETVLSGPGWTVDVTAVPDDGTGDGNGVLSTVVTDANGSHTNLPTTEPDGTVISGDGSNVTITQVLNGGGQLVTNFNRQEWDTGQVYDQNGDPIAAVYSPYINVAQSATGAAVISGSATTFSTGNDTPLLALPCVAEDPNNGGGILPANPSGGNGNSAPAQQPAQAAPAPPPPPPTPAPTPTPIPPALDTNGTAAEEAM